MAKKVGVCVNIDCDNYKKEIEVEPGAEFECPLCHQHLREKPGGKKTQPNDVESGSKNKIIAAVVALLVAGGGAGAYFMMGGDAPEEPVVPVVEEPAKVVPETAPVAEEPAKVEETPEPKVEEAKTPINGKGTVDLGYASYTGDLKNGKPHGYGTLTYKKSQKIVSSKDFVAKPGDTFEGEFRDGKISGLGYWKHDGNQTVVKP